MDRELRRHQERLDAAGERIVELERRGNARAAARLRAVHERVSDDFAVLRRHFGDDWQQVRTNAEAEFRELQDEIAAALKDEMGPIAPMGGLSEREIIALDRSLDEVASEVERARKSRATDPADLAKLEAQIDEARDFRAVIPGAAPSDMRAECDRYLRAVREVIDSWRRYSDHGENHPVAGA